MARQIVPTSGLWSSIAALLNANFAESYQFEMNGIYDYNDAGTSTTPISIAVANTWYPLTNDAAGPFTNKTYALSSVADVWDTASQAFDFSGLELGDTVDIRVDVTATSTVTNQTFDVDLFVADGEAGEYQLPFIIEQAFKSSGAHRLLRFNGIYMGDTNTKDNPAVFKIRSSNTGSVVVNGWYVRVTKRTQEKP